VSDYSQYLKPSLEFLRWKRAAKRLKSCRRADSTMYRNRWRLLTAQGNGKEGRIGPAAGRIPEGAYATRGAAEHAMEESHPYAERSSLAPVRR